VAIQFPVDIPTTIRKPYFIFGDKGIRRSISGSSISPRRADLYSATAATSLEALGPRGLKATSHYDKGCWTVAIKRRLRSQGEITFDEGGFVPVAFSVWDGA
jgi:hypothetical protein